MANLKDYFEYQVFTIEKMYSVFASYFVADSNGVMFFDDKDRGIGFVPSSSLDLIRIAPKPPVDISEILKAQNILSSDKYFPKIND